MRRRWPRAQRPSAVTPPESGPRWTSASVMRATTSGSAGAEGDTSPLMPHTTRKRYAVVSCHVERPLDDEAWARFSRSAAAPAGRVRDRRADAPGRRSRWRGRGNVARASAGGRRPRPARPAHALDGSRPRPPNGRVDRRARARRGPAAARARARAGALLRRRLVHRPGRRGGVRRARLRGLHAASPAALVSRAGEAWASLAGPARDTAPVGAPARGDSDDALARRPRSRALAAAIAAIPGPRLLPRHRSRR